jgi:hypothetical protein
LATSDDALSAAIMRITKGNFQPCIAFFAEIKRFRAQLPLMVTPDLVEVARQGLLLGSY